MSKGGSQIFYQHFFIIVIFQTCMAFFNLWNTKHILTNLYTICVFTMEPKLLPTFLKLFYFVLHRKKKEKKAYSCFGQHESE